MANNVNFIQLSSYTSPAISENSRLGWVEYGDDNDYFQYLIDRYNGSPTNNAVVSGVIDMIFGQGLDALDSGKNTEGYLQCRSLIKDEELKKVINDYYLLGNGAFQVIYNQDKSKIAEVYHMPVECLRAEKCNEEGEIEGYYYAYDWSEVKSKKGADRIPAFGYGSAADKIEILYFRPYRSGSYYYSPVDYQGALPYAELEGEVANYHINNIKNGLAPSMIVNMNNGVPPEEERDIIESQIRHKWGGTSNAGRFILSFNESADSAATIEPVQLSDAHNQYEFLSREAQQKVLVGHRITSPMLFGVKDQTGLGNNADEIKTAFQLFDNTVIKPKQDQVIAALDEILAYNNIALDLYFKTLTPIEFMDLENVVTEEGIEEETGVKVEDQPAQDAEAVAIEKDPEVAEELVQKEASYNGAQIAGAIDIIAKVSEGILTEDQAITFLVQMLQFEPKVANALFSGDSSKVLTEMKSHDNHNHSKDTPAFTKEEEAEWLEYLADKGETIDEEEWELSSVEDVTDPDNEDAIVKAITSIKMSAEDKSSQDAGLYKIRYRYSGNLSGNSRPFCVEMVGLSKGGKVYRKEDINQMSFSGVNGQFAPKGRSVYSIFKYKGGAYCHHKWERLVYMRKRKGGKFLPKSKSEELENDKRVSPSAARSAGVPENKLNPKDYETANTRTIDMPNRGKLN